MLLGLEVGLGDIGITPDVEPPRLVNPLLRVVNIDPPGTVNLEASDPRIHNPELPLGQINPVHRVLLYGQALPHFPWPIAHVLQLTALYLSQVSHYLESDQRLHCADQDGLGLALQACHYVKADVGRHVDGVDVEVAAVQPKVLGFLCFFVWVGKAVLLYAWQALSRGAL